MTMTGTAYAWYHRMVQNHLVQNWDRFLEALQLHVGDSLYKDPHAASKGGGWGEGTIAGRGREHVRGNHLRLKQYEDSIFGR